MEKPQKLLELIDFQNVSVLFGLDFKVETEESSLGSRGRDQLSLLLLLCELVQFSDEDGEEGLGIHGRQFVE